VTGFSKAE